MKIILKYLFVLSFILLISCNSKKNAFGLEDEIYVLADSLEYQELKLALESVFELEINTPLPEKIFTLKFSQLKDLDRIKNRKNIVIVAPLSSGTEVSNFINQIVDDSIKSLFQTEEDFFLTKNDLWAKNQLVTLISAESMQ